MFTRSNIAFLAPELCTTYSLSGGVARSCAREFATHKRLATRVAGCQGNRITRRRMLRSRYAAACQHFIRAFRPSRGINSPEEFSFPLAASPRRSIKGFRRVGTPPTTPRRDSASLDRAEFDPPQSLLIQIGFGILHRSRTVNAIRRREDERVDNECLEDGRENKQVATLSFRLLLDNRMIGYSTEAVLQIRV